jgi:hypothetical protein
MVSRAARSIGPHLGWLAIALLAGWGCNLALGIEKAETIAGAGGTGVLPECNDDLDCDDNNACSADTCVERLCDNAPLDGPAPSQTDGDCLVVSCNAGIAESTADDSDLPVDGKECTDDVCSAGAPSNPNVAGGTPCIQDGGAVCFGDGRCTECFSTADCTMVDETCGGGGTPGVCGCTPMSCSSVNLTCGFASDNGCGSVLNCNNMMQDGTETDVDCGGDPTTCAVRCQAGKACMQTIDCAAGLMCTANVCG